MSRSFIQVGRDGLASPIQPRPTSGEVVYRRLRHAILTGQIRPGARLVETSVAERLMVSRTPVREALRRLESDGFAMRTDRGELCSADFTAQEIADLFLVRRELDDLAARLACQRSEEQDWRKPRRLLETMREVVAEQGNHSVAFLEIHEALHAAVYEIAFNPRMAGWMENHVRFPLAVAAELSYSNDEPTEPPYAQHVRFIDALSSGDLRRAAAAAAAHSAQSADDAQRGRRGPAQP